MTADQYKNQIDINLIMLNLETVKQELAKVLAEREELRAKLAALEAPKEKADVVPFDK